MARVASEGVGTAVSGVCACKAVVAVAVVESVSSHIAPGGGGGGDEGDMVGAGCLWV